MENTSERKFQGLTEAFDHLKSYKIRHGSNHGFFYIESNRKVRRSFFPAEYLGKGWLRQVIDRSDRSTETYYVRPPNELGENEFSPIANQRLLTDIQDLQLEWPHLEINDDTFLYVGGVIKNKKRFYREASLHDLNSDHVDSNYLRHEPGDKLYNKEFFRNYSNMHLTKNDKRIVCEAIVECMMIFFHTQHPAFLEVRHYSEIRKSKVYDRFRVYLFDHDPVEKIVKKFPSNSNLLFLLLSRVSGFFLRFLPTTSELIRCLYIRGKRENRTSTFTINKGSDERVNVKISFLMSELKRLMKE